MTHFIFVLEGVCIHKALPQIILRTLKAHNRAPAHPKGIQCSTTVLPPSDRRFKAHFRGKLLVHTLFVRLVRAMARACARMSIFEKYNVSAFK